MPIHKTYLILLFTELVFSIYSYGQSSAIGIPSAQAETVGLRQSAIDSIHQMLTEHTFGYVDHMLIIKNGNVVFDQAYPHSYAEINQAFDTSEHMYNYHSPTWHPYYQGTDLHTLQSATKSVAGLLVGLAIADGLFESTQDYVLPLLDISPTGTLKDSITLEDLLTMRAGIQWDEWSTDYADPANDCYAMEHATSWVDYILSKPMDTLPGTQFVYSGGSSVLLGALIERQAGIPLTEWAEEKLFNPLGIDHYFWKTSPAGEVDTEGGLYLSIYDFAKLGILMRNKGSWQGKQIVPAAWMERSLDTLCTLNQYEQYGYQWWSFYYAPADYHLSFAGGWGDQFLFWDEEKDLLVVTMGWNIYKQEHEAVRYQLPFWIRSRAGN